MAEVSLTTLAKEAIELKKKIDELAQKVNDLDIFMREVVMVLIDVINTTHATIDELEKRTDNIEQVLLGKKPLETLKLEAREIESAKAPETPIEIPTGGPRPPSTPPPIEPIEKVHTPESTPTTQGTMIEYKQPSLPTPQSQLTPREDIPQAQQIQSPQELPKPPITQPMTQPTQMPSQQAGIQTSQQTTPAPTPAPSPVPPGLHGRLEVIFQLKEALAKRKKQT